MTEHLEMIDYMQRALDDDLDAEGRRLLDAHLETCAECAHDWNALQAVHRQLISSPRLNADSGFSERVLERIAAEQQKERARSANVYKLVFAATILGALSAVLLLAPLAALASPDAWAASMSDALAFFGAAAAWFTILMTLVRVALEALGDGPLVASLIVALGLALVWVRLVAGTEAFKRTAIINGGV